MLYLYVPWCQQVKRGNIDPFVLEEDGDSGHGTEAQSSIVRTLKDEEGITTYDKYASSPEWPQMRIAGKFPSRISRNLHIGMTPTQDITAGRSM